MCAVHLVCGSVDLRACQKKKKSPQRPCGKKFKQNKLLEKCNPTSHCGGQIRKLLNSIVSRPFTLQFWNKTINTAYASVPILEVFLSALVDMTRLVLVWNRYCHIGPKITHAVTFRCALNSIELSEAEPWHGNKATKCLISALSWIQGASIFFSQKMPWPL